MKRILLVCMMSCLFASVARAEKHEWENGLYWELNNGTLTISGNGAMPNFIGPWENKGTVRKVVIEYGVTAIGRCSFWEYNRPHTLQSVEIARSVTSIGERAFSYCTGLTSVTIPNSVTSIGESAFTECRNLNNISIPNSVTILSTGAFFDTGTNGYYYDRNIESLPQWLIEGGKREWTHYHFSEASVRAYMQKKGIDYSSFAWKDEYDYPQRKITNGTTSYYIVSKGGRHYGLTSAGGQVIIPAELDTLAQCGTGYLRFKINGYWGVADYAGKIIIPTDRGYTKIGDYVSFTKRFPYEMDGYKGECNQQGVQLSKIKTETPQQAANTATTSASNNSNKSNTGNGTSTVIVEHHRDPVPVQEWQACFACGGMGTMGCDNCGSSGTKYIGDRLHRCSRCYGRGIIPCNVCYGNKGQYITVYK